MVGFHRRFARLLGTLGAAQTREDATAAGWGGGGGMFRSRGAHPSFARGSDRNGVLFGSCSRMVGSRWLHHTGSPPARQRQRCPPIFEAVREHDFVGPAFHAEFQLRRQDNASAPTTIRLVRLTVHRPPT